jgi:hypothetical protein
VRQSGSACWFLLRDEDELMDLLALFAMIAIPAGMVLLYWTRNPSTSQEIESLEVVKNLGNQDAPKKRGFLAWTSPTSLPFVLTEGEGTIVENVLIFEEYPLVPLRVYSTWIEPGKCIDVLVYKDAGGHVLDIRLAP